MDLQSHHVTLLTTVSPKLSHKFVRMHFRPNRKSYLGCRCNYAPTQWTTLVCCLCGISVSSSLCATAVLSIRLMICVKTAEKLVFWHGGCCQPTFGSVPKLGIFFNHVSKTPDFAILSVWFHYFASVVNPVQLSHIVDDAERLTDYST